MSVSARRRVEALQNIEATIDHFLAALDGPNPALHVGTARPVPLISNSVQDTRRVAVILRVLDLIHKALIDEVVVTKRDIYYQDPELFENQAVVDRVVDQLAASFNTTRASLNVAAAAKGLAIGNFIIRRRDSQLLVCNDRDPQLIPTLDEHDVLEVGPIDWILVVEKEATFSGLVSARFTHQTDIGKGIMITGKGYPDLATRALLRRLSMSHPRSSPAPDILALVDHDPDGIAIMSTYKHGSDTLSHENGELVVPRLQWLGVKQEDVIQTSHGLTIEGDTDVARGILRMTRRDRTKAAAMLERGVCAESGSEAEWRQELQSMLMTNIKAEIQLLENRPDGLVGWLRTKLARYGTAVESDPATASTQRANSFGHR